MFNKKNIVIITICFFFLFRCSDDETEKTVLNDENNIAFIKTLGGTLNDVAQSIIKTTDGGYAILGYAQSNDGDITDKQDVTFDYWLLKFDENNNLQWQKTYGGSDDDRGNSLIQTLDGGYIINGYSQSSDGDVNANEGANDFWISKLDSNGTIQWEKNYGFSGVDSGISVIQTNDNGYLLTGVLDVTASGGLGNKTTATKHAGGDYWAIKLDALGDKQWSNYFGGSNTDTPYDVIQTSESKDNGYIIVGSSDSNDVDIKSNKGSYDFWVIKISTTGNLIWEKSFGGQEIDEARAISSSGDGNYIIVGDTRSQDTDVLHNNGASDLWVIKISPSGELIWETTFGGSSFDAGRSIFKTQDNGFLISGSSRSLDGDLNSNNGQNDAWVLKIDANANIEWQKIIGGTGIDFTYDAVELNNKTIIAVGESSNDDLNIIENKGFTDILLLKIN